MWSHTAEWGPAPRDVPAPANDAIPFELSQLLDHIVERYHRAHPSDLAVAIALAEQIELNPASAGDLPQGFVDSLRRLASDLEAHQRREELSLFPMLKSGRPRFLDFVTRRMMDDHIDMEGRLAVLHTFNANRTSFGASLCRQGLSFVCLKLERELREHARLEHEVLYDALLRQGAAA